MNWPAGQGGKGNEGVAALVKQVPNSIGYVEYAYAKQNNIPVALIQNKNGKFPQPEDKAFQAAAASADWNAAPGFGISLTNQPGDEAWPITAPTFILIPKSPEKPEQIAEVLKFFRLGLQERRQARVRPRLRAAPGQRGRHDPGRLVEGHQGQVGTAAVASM